VHRKPYLHDIDRLRVHTRGYLPHWQIEGSTYSVTIRLADSLPRAVIDRLREEHRRLQRVVSGRELRAQIELDYERELHRAEGAAYMADPRIADVVARTLTYFDGLRYDLEAWCVMPNHAHVVVTPRSPWRLQEILHSWKSFSANAINRMLRRSGPVWQPEYFDRIIRDETDLMTVVEYVLGNPKKAGLADWRWTSADWT
jgi:REP element-mobilizing transposase RayT